MLYHLGRKTFKRIWEKYEPREYCLSVSPIYYLCYEVYKQLERNKKCFPLSFSPDDWAIMTTVLFSWESISVSSFDYFLLVKKGAERGVGRLGCCHLLGYHVSPPTSTPAPYHFTSSLALHTRGFRVTTETLSWTYEGRTIKGMQGRKAAADFGQEQDWIGTMERQTEPFREESQAVLG